MPTNDSFFCLADTYMPSTAYNSYFVSKLIRFCVKAEMDSTKIVLIYLIVVAGVHLSCGQCLNGWGSVFGCRKVCNKIFYSFLFKAGEFC